MTIGYRGNLIVLRYAAGETPQTIQLKMDIVLTP